MKKHHSMHHIILIGLLAVAAIAGLMFVKNRFFGGMGSFMQMGQSSGDVMIMNDSSEAMSVEYKENGKDVDAVVQPGKSVSGGHGLIRMFTAKKAGAYELTYTYPHAAQQVTVSQIIAAAKQDKMEGELYTKRGMIGDIKVFYEEVEQE
jgi:hypothetical protein